MAQPADGGRPQGAKKATRHVTPPIIPGFTFTKHIGSGGFSDVYLATQESLGRQVAVKVLENLQHGIDSFRAESNLMARLSNHPSIVSIFAADVTEKGEPYLVMEFCPPPHLGRRVRHNPLSVEEALTTGIQLAGAVESMHRAGVVHCDIKPANILLTQYGRPALTDFGISSTVDQAGTGKVAGVSTPWAPPEQLDGDAPGPSGDVYSLAASLYHMLAGRAPFGTTQTNGGDNRDGKAILRNRIRAEEVPPIGRPDVPPKLEAVIVQAMAKDPYQRQSSAISFGRSLQRLQRELKLATTNIDVLYDSEAATGSGIALASDGEDQHTTMLPVRRGQLPDLDEHTAGLRASQQSGAPVFAPQNGVGVQVPGAVSSPLGQPLRQSVRPGSPAPLNVNPSEVTGTESSYGTERSWSKLPDDRRRSAKRLLLVATAAIGAVAVAAGTVLYTVDPFQLRKSKATKTQAATVPVTEASETPASLPPRSIRLDPGQTWDSEDGSFQESWGTVASLPGAPQSKWTVSPASEYVGEPDRGTFSLLPTRSTWPVLASVESKASGDGIVALNRKTGEKEWVAKDRLCDVDLWRDVVVCVSVKSPLTLQTLDPKTGKVKIEQKVENVPGRGFHLTVTEGGYYIAGAESDGNLVRVSRYDTDGKLMWGQQTELDAREVFGIKVAENKGKTYLLGLKSSTGSRIVLDSKTGALSSDQPAGVPAAVIGGRVFDVKRVGSDPTNVLLGRSLGTAGKDISVNTFTSKPFPAQATTPTHLVVSTATGTVAYDLDNDTGEVAWKAPVQPMAVCRGTLVGAQRKAVVGIDMKTGKEHWRIKVDTPERASAVCDRNNVLFSTAGGPFRPPTKIMAVDLLTGSVSWSTPCASKRNEICPVRASGGDLFTALGPKLKLWR